MRFLVLVAGLTGLVVSGVGAGSQGGQQPPAQPGQAFAAATTAVMVDVVVRDKQGRPVTDLTAADFELYEDDVRQEIGALALIAPGTGPAGLPSVTGLAGTDAPARGGTVPAPTFVALAFDRLSPEGRALAHKGAMAYLGTSIESDFAGVFLIDMSLETIQTYTNDRARLRKALDDVASRATSSFSRGADAIRAAGKGSTAPATSPTAGVESPGAGGLAGTPTAPTGPADAGNAAGMSAMAEALAQRVAERMERSYESMMRDQQGYATTDSLLVLVDSLGLLPGRKTVIFFAEGLAIPANVQARFESVVANANRVNVSVYTVDAAGLRVQSKQSEAGRQVAAIAESNFDRVTRTDSGGMGLKDMELNEDILRADPAVGLGLLASRTGGFLINNTNDLERGFRTIDGDRRFHYLLTYTPKKADFSGEWRRLAVKVPKRDVLIRSRAGYLAVRAPGALPVLTYEGPALAALERTPRPADVPVRGGAFTFPRPGQPAAVPVLVAADASTLTFKTEGQGYRTDFTVLARVRDAQGEIVRKASQPYRLTGQAAQVDSARKGDVLFFRQPSLPPGAYTLEYVVHDALAAKSGTGSMPFTVPDAKAEPMAVSSLLLVRRTEKVAPGDRTPDNPLYYGELLLYPSLGEPFRKSADKTLSFFVAVYPAAGSAAPSASLTLSQKGTPIGQIPLPLPAPEADGRIAVVSQLPLANFPAGEYGLSVTVTQGTAKAVRTASFIVTD